MADTDLLVIGAGAAGLGAARAGRAAGRRVTLVEAEKPGGDCTHTGCVPSKALLETARRVHAARSGARYGFRAEVDVDGPAVLRRLHEVIAEVEQDESVERLTTKEGIDYVDGFARFTGPAEVDVAGRRITAERVVVATGGTAAVPPVEGLDAVPFLTNREVFGLSDLPGHLVVLGGGAIGCELAQAFARLGSAVTVVEALPRLLSREEPMAGDVVARVLRREGVDVRLGVGASAVRGGAGEVELTLADGSTVAGTHLLVGAGRRPVTDGLDCAAAGIALDERGGVVVDARLRTSNPRVYAVGDVVAGNAALTHVADEQGRLAVANAFAPRWKPGTLTGAGRWTGRVVPRVVYTEPEVAAVGLTEAEAFARWGERARVTTVPMAVMDRARASGMRDGFVQLVAAPTGAVKAKPLDRLVGMTVVGEAAGEVVAEGALAMQLEVPVGRLAQTIHAYPTHAIAVRIAAAMFYRDYGGVTARPARAPR